MVDADIALAPLAPRRILVMGPSWLGDMVMAQSLFRALFQVPGTVIDVLAPAPFGPLLSRMPEVSEHIESPFRPGKLDFRERHRLGRELSGRGYHQAIILPNSWKSALTPFWTRIPLRTGYVGEQRWGLVNDIRKLDKSKLPMTVQRFVALAGPEGAADTDIDLIRPRLESRPQAQKTTAGLFGVAVTDQPVLVLCPGAQYGPAKQWPAEYFAKIASARMDRGWQVCILGSSTDATVAGEINGGDGGERCIDLTGKTSLDQAMDIMGLAEVIVSNDSGLMHVAAALGKPLVAIFGSTDPAHTPPLSANSTIEYLNLSCSPCFERECPLQHLNCLTGVTPDRILHAMDEVAG